MSVRLMAAGKSRHFRSKVSPAPGGKRQAYVGRRPRRRGTGWKELAFAAGVRRLFVWIVLFFGIVEKSAGMLTFILLKTLSCRQGGVLVPGKVPEIEGTAQRAVTVLHETLAFWVKIN